MAVHCYKTILKKIILKLGFGFKKDRIEACLGEEIPLQLDESLFKGNVKRAKKTTRKNSFARWNKEDGSEITDSKTIQDEEGNTDTTVAQPEKDLTFTLENSANIQNSNTRFRLRTGGENSGDPYINYAIAGKTNWSTGINNIDRDAFIISNYPNLSSRKFFRINTQGNLTIPNQYTAFAVLTENTGFLNTEYEYFLGQGAPMTVIENVGGYFFPGGGSPENPATFTLFEEGTFLVYLSCLVYREDNPKKNQGQIYNRIRISGSKSRSTGFLNVLPSSYNRNCGLIQTGVKGLAGDVIKFSVTGRIGGQRWRLSKELDDTYVTFVGIRCLG